MEYITHVTESEQFSKPKLGQYSRIAQEDNDVEAAVQFHVAGM